MTMLSALECFLQAIMKQDRSVENEERACCTSELGSGPMGNFNVYIGALSGFILLYLACHCSSCSKLWARFLLNLL